MVIIESIPSDKKKFITPEDKAKQNMAKSLFGGLKGPAPPKAQPQPIKKKIEKIETVDLI